MTQKEKKGTSISSWQWLKDTSMYFGKHCRALPFMSEQPVMCTLELKSKKVRIYSQPQVFILSSHQIRLSLQSPLHFRRVQYNFQKRI